MSTYLKAGKPLEYDNAPDWLVGYMKYRRTVLANTPASVMTDFKSLREFFQWLSPVIYTGKQPISEAALRSVSILELPLEDVLSVQKGDIESYLYFLSDTLGNEAATRNRKLVAIRGFYNYLLDQQEHLGITLNGNPASRISRPKQAKKLPVYLPAEDQKALLNTIGGENGVRDYAIFLLLLTTGMRISELVNINMTDLNLKGRTIRIHGKGNKERTANLTEPCCDAIRRYLEEYRDLIPEGDLLSPALFTSKRRRDRLTARGLEKTMRNYVLAAGLGGLGYTPHKLRHTMATMLAKDGVDLMVIQNVLGHADPGTTEIYTHLDSSDIRAAIQKSSVRELGAIRPVSSEGDSNDSD